MNVYVNRSGTRVRCEPGSKLDRRLSRLRSWALGWAPAGDLESDDTSDADEPDADV